MREKRAVIVGGLFAGNSLVCLGWDVDILEIALEAKLSEAFRTKIFNHYAFLFMLGSQLIGYPIDGADGFQEPGKRRYQPASEEKLAYILTDASG